jgi:hypothetical protein
MVEYDVCDCCALDQSTVQRAIVSIDIAVEAARRQQHMADLAAWQLQPGDARLLMPEMPILY